MKINAVEIRPGNILEFDGGLWRAVVDRAGHRKPMLPQEGDKLGACHICLSMVSSENRFALCANAALRVRIML